MFILLYIKFDAYQFIIVYRFHSSVFHQKKIHIQFNSKEITSELIDWTEEAVKLSVKESEASVG